MAQRSQFSHARWARRVKILDDKRRATLSNHATQRDNSSVVDYERRTQPGTGPDHEVWQYQHFLAATIPVKSPYTVRSHSPVCSWASTTISLDIVVLYLVQDFQPVRSPPRIRHAARVEGTCIISTSARGPEPYYGR